MAKAAWWRLAEWPQHVELTLQETAWRSPIGCERGTSQTGGVEQTSGLSKELVQRTQWTENRFTWTCQLIWQQLLLMKVSKFLRLVCNYNQQQTVARGNPQLPKSCCTTSGRRYNNYARFIDWNWRSLRAEMVESEVIGKNTCNRSQRIKAQVRRLHKTMASRTPWIWIGVRFRTPRGEPYKRLFG